MVLVQISIFSPLWQASDAISPRATESAHRPFLKFATEPTGLCQVLVQISKKLAA